MSGFKGIAKGGWHPKGKDGGKESWRGDFKGINQIAGWMGKGKDTTSQAYEHQSAPLSSLRDPSEFEPPPRRVPGVSSPPTNRTSAGALDSAPSSDEGRTQAQRSTYAPRKGQEEPEEEEPPPGPYRTDTTGLSTANLPPPPKFRGDGAIQAEDGAPKPKPKLPPRLPPRQSNAADPSSPPPSYGSTEQAAATSPNQSAADRLGRAGVSVPGLGIGKPSSPSLPLRADSTSPTRLAAQSSPPQSQLSELQARFAHMRTPSSETSSTGTSAGTTWAQKRAALDTATSFKKDPSSVSASDVRNAASTANNFRERHGEQVAAGWKAASGLNQKYAISDRVKVLSSNGTESTEAPPTPSSPGTAAAAHKKPPPPPPPKKHELSGNSSVPPPLPIGSKPRPT